MRWVSISVVGVLLLALSGAAETPKPPRLVLLIAIDQLRRDRLDPSLPGGLGRLAREGRVYVEGALDHAMTETCPGHATMLTGRHPGKAGVPGNRFLGGKKPGRVYCVEDDEKDAKVIGADRKRSPRSLRVDALGDWLKRSRPESRVFTVSAKDRAAITLGGVGPDGVYWLERDDEAAFTTSRYYRDKRPKWVKAFNKSFPKRLPKSWRYEASPEAPRSDDFAGESQFLSRTSPHPLGSDEREELLNNLYFSPYLDEVTLDFALELFRREQLGRGEDPDLLAVALSATDTVGHLYGPWSVESWRGRNRLDTALGRFLEAIEHEIGPGGLLVALTADHGVMALPEWLSAQGATTRCPVPGGRKAIRQLAETLSASLRERFPELPKKATKPEGFEHWVAVAGSQIAVRRDTARKYGLDVPDVVAWLEEALEAEAMIAEVWTPDELEKDSPMARLYRNSRDPERSGDLLVQVKEGCILWSRPEGTTHGSPYEYDRAVPIVFFGANVVPGKISGRATTVDIAPTLARQLGVAVPPDVDGRPLF